MENIIVKNNKIFLQEAVIFVCMFILTMLHEWISIDTMMGLFKGLIFFILIYSQAQIHRFFIFPFFLKRRLTLYISLTLLSTLTGAILLFFANVLWLWPDYYKGSVLIWEFVYFFVLCIMSTFTVMSLSLMQQYALEIQKRSKDQLLLNEMNLKFLYAQLNPHFFFNMLNNLYGVSLAEPDRTPNLIIKLSELMRYQIENANRSQVSLKDEIVYITNYVGMEKERIGKRCDIQFNHPVDNKTLEGYYITPLMLIILIENAFKHSLNIEHWFVNININLRDSILELTIHNSLPNDMSKQKSTGIGLNNVKQRLSFLYKDKFELISMQNENSYSTSLTLNIEKHNHG